MTANLPGQISPEQISQILKRASELDAQRESLTGAELARIAAEAGIHPAATEAAIHEVMGHSVHGEGRPLGGQRAVNRLLRLIALGAGVGAVAGGLGAVFPEAMLASGIGLGVYALFRAAREMFRDGRLEFHLQNIAMWGAYLGAASIDAQAWKLEEYAATALIGWVASAILGTFIIRRGASLSPDDD